MSAPVSAEVAAHDLTTRLMEIGARALRAAGRVIDRADTAPRWNPLERWARRREREAVLDAIGYMLGEQELPDA